MKKAKAKASLEYPEYQDNAALAARVEEGLPVAELVQFGGAHYRRDIVVSRSMALWCIGLDVFVGAVCISTQVGCAMKCTFCLTGDLGLKRHVTPAEIANQTLQVQKDLDAGAGDRLGRGRGRIERRRNRRRHVRRLRQRRERRHLIARGAQIQRPRGRGSAARVHRGHAWP